MKKNFNGPTNIVAEQKLTAFRKVRVRNIHMLLEAGKIAGMNFSNF